MLGMKRRKGVASTVNSMPDLPTNGYALPEYPFSVPPELLEGKRHHHAVVIVGGGLTGLTLACRLAQLRVPAVLLDEDNTVGVKGASSRGICYTQQSLEIFQRLGIYERIAAKGIAWQVGRTFAGNDEVFSFDLREKSQFSFSQQPPFTNIQQFYIEMYLVERIQELNRQGASIDLRWSSKVTTFEQNKDRALLGVSTPEGGYQITASHVIDASGSHTPFHAWVGATMDSKRGDDRWCIADVRFQHQPPTERHTWIEAPFNDNRAVWQHLMGDDVWRIDYQMAPDADPAYVSRDDVVRERLAKQFGPNVACELVWVGPYAYKSQCLHQLRHGHVFFLGDTAKVVSPFGARGGNTGIADADNLAWKLAAVIRQQAPSELLNSYNHSQYNVRFCLICNYISRIDEALQTEFVRLRFNQLPVQDIVRFMQKVSAGEGLNLSDAAIGSIQKQFNSDIRSMVNYMQTNQDVHHGHLAIATETNWDEITADLKKGTGAGRVQAVCDKLKGMSHRCNLDRKHMMKIYANHVIRREPDLITPEFLNKLENVMHTTECNIDHVMQYLVSNFAKCFATATATTTSTAVTTASHD